MVGDHNTFPISCFVLNQTGLLRVPSRPVVCLFRAQGKITSKGPFRPSLDPTDPGVPRCRRPWSPGSKLKIEKQHQNVFISCTAL